MGLIWKLLPPLSCSSVGRESTRPQGKSRVGAQPRWARRGWASPRPSAAWGVGTLGVAPLFLHFTGEETEAQRCRDLLRSHGRAAPAGSEDCEGGRGPGWGQQGTRLLGSSCTFPPLGLASCLLFAHKGAGIRGEMTYSVI